jgi:hypothetical protein
MGSRIAAFMAKREIDKENSKVDLKMEAARANAAKDFAVDISGYKNQIATYKSTLREEASKDENFAKYLRYNQEMPNILTSVESKCDQLDDLVTSTSERYVEIARKHAVSNNSLNEEIKRFDKEQRKARKAFYGEVSPFEAFASIIGLTNSKVKDRLKENVTKRKELIKKIYRQKLEQTDEIKRLKSDFNTKKGKIIAKIEAKIGTKNDQAENNCKNEFEIALANAHSYIEQNKQNKPQELTTEQKIEQAQQQAHLLAKLINEEKDSNIKRAHQQKLIELSGTITKLTLRLQAEQQQQQPQPEPQPQPEQNQNPDPER